MPTGGEFVVCVFVRVTSVLTNTQIGKPGAPQKWDGPTNTFGHSKINLKNKIKYLQLLKTTSKQIGVAVQQSQ